MKLLVDTSIWSLALRQKPHILNKEALILKNFIEQGEDIYLVGIILQEILQGIKNPKDFLQLKEYLEAFPLIELTREDYVKAAKLKNILIKKGRQISTFDALIAHTAISRDLYLFTADNDFSHIAKSTKLKLLSNNKI
jgi:predicted nucleic acid-binding protein